MHDEQMEAEKERRGIKDKSALIADNSGAMRGVPRIQRESVDDVSKSVNPNYYTIGGREYDQNCANCVVASELRFRGYDVQARKRIFSKNSKIDRFFYDNRQGSGSWTDSFNGMIGEELKTSRKAQALNAITEKMKEYGDNSRAIIFIQWDGQKVGHYFNVINDNGQIILYDAQKGLVGKEVEDYLLYARPSQTRIWRTDDKDITEFARKVVTWDE